MPVDNETETVNHRIHSVEIFIDDVTGDYVEYDHSRKAEIVRRPATNDETLSFGDDNT